MNPSLISQSSPASNDSLLKPQLDVSIVVPIYNEVKGLPQLIEAIASSLNDTGLSYELICVDDGSKDGSAELLKQQALSRPYLRAVIC